MNAPEAVRGLLDLLVGALAGGTTRVEEMHAAVARRPFEALAISPVTAGSAALVRKSHDAIVGLVYESIRGVMRVIGAASGLALHPVALGSEKTELGLPPAADLALAALNGIAGDALERSGNGLRFRMELRAAGRALALERADLSRAYPEASRRLAVFVHGLACSEAGWRFYSERHYGNRDTTYGSRLEHDLGYTPLYLRYNSGLHISENGRLLAALLEELVSAWPVEVEEITLIGHSMGGLVARSACHHGRKDEARWVGRVRHVVYLGSPHLGAPLEKLGNAAAWLLSVSDVTRPLAGVLNGRSTAIKDLRFGYLVEEDWKDRDPDALLENYRHDVPLLETAAHYFVAATMTRDPRHPLAWVIGDTLVRLPSASGRARDPARRIAFRDEHRRHVAGMHHLELLNHPVVYEQIRSWLLGTP